MRVDKFFWRKKGGIVQGKSHRHYPLFFEYRAWMHSLLCPWDSPGKNTGVGCHFLLQCMKVKSESEVAQSVKEEMAQIENKQQDARLKPS